MQSCQASDEVAKHTHTLNYWLKTAIKRWYVKIVITL